MLRSFTNPTRLLINASRRTFISPSNVTFDSTTQEVMKLGKLNHVAIAVPCLKSSVNLFQNILGAQCSEASDIPEHGVTTVFVDLGNTKIELLQKLGDASPIAKFLDKNPSGGIHHICIEVKDINTAIQNVKEKGLVTLGDKAKIGAHGKPVIFLHPKSVNGILLELEQE